MYSLNLMKIALELAMHDHVYEDIATKFFEHFLLIAEAMTNIAGAEIGLWDEEDQFYYDELNFPDGRVTPLRVRSMVGLIPLFAVEVLEPDTLAKLPGFHQRLKWFLKNHPELHDLVSRWEDPGTASAACSLLRGHRMKRLLARMLDETEFLSPYGVRALSKFHEDNPYRFHWAGQEISVGYQPAESDSGLFGGNSNWRGPIWFPVNYLLIESIRKFHKYYGDDFRVECPTGSGNFLTCRRSPASWATACATSFSRMPPAAGRSSATTRRCRTTRISATTCSSTSTSTATPVAVSAPRTRPAGQGSSPSCSSRSLPPHPLEIVMRTVLTDGHPPVVMPSCQVRRVLKGQKALVTGASSGIGKAVAIALGQAGADVVVNYVAGLEQAELVADEIRREGVRAIAHQADVSQEDQVQAMFARMAGELGGVDILVANAGLQKDVPFEEMTLKDWNTVIGVNLTGQFLCARRPCAPSSARVRADISCAAGKIVCMSSVHDTIPWAGHVNYAASKGA